MALPPPIELFETARFKVGDRVQTLPDTTPGIDPRQSVAIYGTVVEVEADIGWKYLFKSMHSERNKVSVPENRVLAISKLLYDNTMLETRAFPVQERLRATRHLK